jgi:hypothetical protein
MLIPVPVFTTPPYLTRISSFVNKFEWNSTWGDGVGGDIGTDGTGIFRIKNSYADFTTGMARFKVGTQGAVINRGFAFDDDFAGIYAGVNAGDMASTPIRMGKSFRS